MSTCGRDGDRHLDLFASQCLASNFAWNREQSIYGHISKTFTRERTFAFSLERFCLFAFRMMHTLAKIHSCANNLLNRAELN